MSIVSDMGYRRAVDIARSVRLPAIAAAVSDLSCRGSVKA